MLALNGTDNDPFYYRSREDVLEQVKKGYDGEMKRGYYRVNYPNQIKSATDNVGTFSRDDNSIYASRRESIERKGIQSIEDVFGSDLFGLNNEIEKDEYSQTLFNYIKCSKE